MEQDISDKGHNSMSDFLITYIIMKYQIKFYLKTRRFIAMFAIIMLITSLTVILDFYTGISNIQLTDPTSSNFIISGLGGVVISCGIVSAFFGGDATSIETGTNSGYYIMVQPVRKISILSGRFLAAFLMGFMLILIEYAGVAAMSQYIYGTIEWRIIYSIGEMALLVIAFTALAFFFSSLFKSPLIGILVSVIMFLVFFSILDSILALTSIEPWFSLYYGGQVVTEIISSAPVVHSTTNSFAKGKFTITIYNPYIWEGNLIMIGYAIVSIVLSYIIFLKKEVRPQ